MKKYLLKARRLTRLLWWRRFLVKRRIFKRKRRYVRGFVLNKLINVVMQRGLKIKARNHVFSSFKTVKLKKRRPPLLVLKRAILNLAPVIALRKVYRSGRGLQIPYMVTFDVSLKIAIRWLVKYARERQGYDKFSDKLAAEINDAYQKSGFAYEQKLNIYRIANENATNLRFLK